MTAEDVFQRLRVLYNDREWALLPQVANGTGGHYARTADAIALNCWPSRGMELHGFEIKLYRGDFKREMENPEKAEAMAQYCDRWFLVVPDDAIVKANELPPTWGLIIADDKPRIIVGASKLEPKQLSRAFLAAVLRAAQKEGGVSQSEHQKALNAKWKEAFEVGMKSASTSVRDQERVRWQIESLLEIERRADSVLKSIRRELTEVKRMKTAPPVDVPDDGEPANG